MQDNQSYSAKAGTIRGLHYQRAPFAQDKLVRCIRGAIIDYAVDIRRGSPSYGQYVSAELTANGGEQLFVPIGFAHGFMTLSDDVEVVYKVSNFYAPESEAGIRWDDPDIAIDWPTSGASPLVSEKDAALPFLSRVVSQFEYDGQPL